MKLGLPSHPDWSFFGVFDGHGGSAASAFASKNLLGIMAENPSWSKPTLSDDDVRAALFDGLLETDKRLRQVSSESTRLHTIMRLATMM